MLCPYGQFPVFASTCERCAKEICLDCAVRTEVSGNLAKLIQKVRPGLQFLSFRCPSCQEDFPSDRYPVHLFAYENFLGDVDYDHIKRLNDPSPLLRLYGYDVSRVQGLKENQQHILRADGVAVLLTAGVSGVMPIRCSSKTGR